MPQERSPRGPDRARHTGPMTSTPAEMTETRFWHPFADMSAVKNSEFVVDRGEDVWVWDTNGRRYLDGTASLWYANVGHGRREIADAITEQLGKLEAYSAFGDFGNEPRQRADAATGRRRSGARTRRSSSAAAAATASRSPPSCPGDTGTRWARPSARSSSAARAPTTARTATAPRSPAWHRTARATVSCWPTPTASRARTRATSRRRSSASAPRRSPHSSWSR